MVLRHSTVTEAYEALGLEQGSSLELVKSTYKQLALKTHPDKNPGNEDATAQFQRISEAYNVLLKSLDRSSSPPHRHTYHPFAGPFDYEEDEDDYYDEYSDYDDEYDSDYEEDLDFYMYLFERLMRGKANRYDSRNYYHYRAHESPESPEQHQARIRRMCEEQEEAEARRARENADIRAARDEKREKDRREAEARQKQKASKKKSEAEALRKAAEEKAREQQARVQTLRSRVFDAARCGQAEKVKKGIWEDEVDATGGEVKKGAETLVNFPPDDPQETLMHIAAKIGDADLVEWLDTHSADPEEHNADGLTPFHVAVHYGRVSIVKYFLETYNPQDSDFQKMYATPDSRSLLSIALDSREPEVVWMILDRGLASKDDMNKAWSYVTSEAGKKAMSKSPNLKQTEGTLDEIVNLLVTFGGFTLSSKPTSQPKGSRGSAHGRSPSTRVHGLQHSTLPPSDSYSKTRPPSSPSGLDSASNGSSSPGPNNRTFPRRRNYQQKYPSKDTPVRNHQSTPSISASHSEKDQYPPHQQANGFTHGQSQSHNPRGRGRGRGWGRGHSFSSGRGRGGVPLT